MGSQNDVVLHKRRVVPRCYGRVLEQHNDRAIGTYLNAIRASLLRRANCVGDVGLRFGLGGLRTGVIRDHVVQV